MITQTRIVSDDGAFARRFSADRSGLTVTILGGIHGDEDIGVLAVRILETFLSTALESGTVRTLAPANPSAHHAFLRESPIDGINLARSFPGNPDGSVTERIAHFITTQLILGSDLLIDLHSASSQTAMPLFCGFSRAAAVEGSRRAAAAFAAPITWEHTSPTPLGRSISVAEEHEIASIYVESEGGGQLLASNLDAYLAGVKRVLAEFGLVSAAVAPLPPAASSRWIEASGGDTDASLTAPVGGCLVTHVTVGDQVNAGDLLGVIYDDRGGRAAEIGADAEGTVMLLRHRTRVARGDAIAMIAGHGP